MVKNKKDIKLVVENYPELVKYVNEFMQDAIGIRTVSIKQDPEIVNSKIGGYPDVFEDFEWPTYRKKPMSFIAQINCAQITSFDKEKFFPEEGVLYFFWYTGDNDFRDISEPRYKVIFDQGNRKPQGNLNRENKPMPFDEVFMDFYAYYSLPGGETSYDIEFSEEIDDDALFDCREEIEEKIFNRVENKHQMLGYPDSLQSSVTLNWAIQHLKLHPEALSNQDIERIKGVISDFKLIVQIDCEDNKLNFNKYASVTSKLYFGIHKENLRERNFDKSLFVFQNY